MPAKGRARITDKQREQIAAGRLAGKLAREIATETGLSRSAVDHAATDPRTVAMALRLKHKKAPQIERMFDSVLNTMERDLESKDPAVRSGARSQFLRLLPLGDPPLLRIAPTDNSGGDFLLEDLLKTYRSVQLPQRANK
jgi:hypothetical protein